MNNTDLQYYIHPYDIYNIKTTYRIGQKIYQYVDEFCENCQIEYAGVYRVNFAEHRSSTGLQQNTSDASNSLCSSSESFNQEMIPMLHIRYLLDSNIHNLSIDLQKHDISYIFRRKWETDIHNVHCELFRKFSLSKIHDLHEDLMASYWHIDNMPIWYNQLSYKWGVERLKL